MVKIKANRVEQTTINKNHPMYKTIKDFSIRSNNFYNYALYYVRQSFILENKYKGYQILQKELKTHEPYKQLMSQSSQCVLQVLDRNWKSFFEATKDYKKNPSKYLGRPKIPKYKAKGSSFTWFLKNNNTYIKDGKLYFRLKVFNGYGFKTNVKDRLISVRFVPRNDVFILEIVYEKEIQPKTDVNSNFVSIDLGVDNFVTMINNIGKPPVIIKGKVVKSINQGYNKTRAEYQSKLPKGIHWSKYLDIITRKRNNKIKNFIHHSSRFIVKYCIENNIDTIIVGINKEWKQESPMGKVVNQNFVLIPFDMLLRQLEYKCQDYGLALIKTEESYTSGTSFLDGEMPIKTNYNKKRRIKRGLFKTETGRLINSDVNGSYQISRKVFPYAFSNGIEVCLTPVIIRSIINVKQQ